MSELLETVLKKSKSCGIIENRVVYTLKSHTKTPYIFKNMEATHNESELQETLEITC